MKKTLFYFTIILLLSSCSRDKQSESDEITTLFPAPQTLALNTKDGYKINLVTGNSILPIINSLGDTIKTGVPVPAKGKVIPPDSVGKPKIISAGKPEVVFTHMNVEKIQGPLTVIPVNKESLKTFTPGVDTSSFVLKNSTGDIVPTGVPIPAKGKVVPCIQSEPIEALLPRIKDKAITNMRFLGLEQGMNSTDVRSILEDSRGNIWFGTWSGGVSMYNGQTFTHYSVKEGLSDNSVLSCLEDSSGNLWFGTWGGGVSMYNGEFFTHFTEKEGLCNNDVWSILEDSSGNIWFGTERGVSLYNGKSFTHFTKKEGLSDNRVWSILEDSHGYLWFGTEVGVNMYDGETFTHFTEKDGLSNNVVRSILEDSRGHLWFGTEGRGVSMYDGESFTHFTEKEGLSNNSVYSILEDSRGNLWFGTLGGGVNMYNGKTFTHFTENEGLSNNSVYSILEDSHDNLWFGTDSGGVSVYNSESFTHFTEKESVRSILEDSHGNLWFGTLGGGVSLYNGESFTHFTEKEGLSNNRIRSILEDSHGNLWFGTNNGGVSLYDGETFTHFTENEGLSNNDVWSILEDSSGNLWFGTRGGGVSLYNGEFFTHFTDTEGLSDNWVLSILEDSSGNIWFGTWDGGVSLYNGETFTHFTEKEGLSNHVSSILEDSRGYIWFGTFGEGVSLYNGESFTHFTEKEGLSDNRVWSILEDRNSNIWIGTEKGLNRIELGPESGKASFYTSVIHTYSEQDGLIAMNFLQANSMLLDSKNRSWWGTGKSLTMLDMNNFEIPVEAPATMQLDRIDIMGKFVDYRQLNDIAGMEMEFDGVEKFYNYPLNLKLPYNRNHLTFHFSAIDWSAPHKIRYSFNMEGLDDNWSPPTSEAIADYRSLPHGTFTFKVHAIGDAQKWSETFEYFFTISPPWWRTNWFRILMVLIIVGCIGTYFNRHTHSLRKRKEELEAEVEERTKEAVAATQAKSEFLANMSHELRTPLNAIIGFSEILNAQTFGDINEKQQTYVNYVLTSGKHLLSLINDILDLSKVESGKMELHPSKVSIATLLENCMVLIKEKAMKQGIQLDLKIPKEMENFTFEADERKLKQVVFNLLSNSAKFTQEGGSIETTTWKKGKKLFVCVTDTGIGLKKENLEKVFGKFEQVDSTLARKQQGTGLGLALSRELIELHRGKMWAESEGEGKGCKFTFVLPISKSKKGKIL